MILTHYIKRLDLYSVLAHYAASCCPSLEEHNKCLPFCLKYKQLTFVLFKLDANTCRTPGFWLIMLLFPAPCSSWVWYLKNSGGYLVKNNDEDVNTNTVTEGSITSSLKCSENHSNILQFSLLHKRWWRDKSQCAVTCCLWHRGTSINPLSVL